MNLRSIGFRQFLENDEQVLCVFRESFSFTLGRILLHAIGWGALALLVWFFYPTRLFWGWIAILAFGFFKIFSVFSQWYVNAVLMTNESLMFIEWDKPFHSLATRLNYWDIDQIIVERKGIAAFLGNFGDLQFVKHSTGEPHVFKWVRHPRRIAKVIHDYQEQILKEKNFTEETALKDLISQLVISHVRKHGQPERNQTSIFELQSSIEGEEESGGEVGKKEKGKRKKKEEFEELHIEVEKELDNEGGIEIDLE